MSIYSVNVYPSSITIKTGNWYYDAYAVVDASGNCCKDVKWYSDKPSVATVNALSGYIYGCSPGTAKIYARSKVDSSKEDYITVTVTSGNISVDSVTLDKSGISLEKGKTCKLTETVCPPNATNKKISWCSTDTSVATVSEGLVTAKAKGNACIFAEAQDGSGEYDFCYVNVTENVLVTSVSASWSKTSQVTNKTLAIGKSAYAYETVSPSNATNKCVSWSSNNTNVATVNPDTGLVIAQGEGTATITATAQDGSNKKGYCTITVNPPIAVTGVEVCPQTKTLNIGETSKLNVTIYPTDATNKRVTWCSSNEDVACVDYYTGEIYANDVGSAVITATTVDGEFTSCCTVKVVIDTVTIQKDGVFNKVVFNKTGKVWRCINRDMIYNEDNKNSSLLINRSNQNFYIDADPTFETTTTIPKEYTDEEIKLLYAIDPYGVADYVRRYSETKNGLRGTLQEKDRIFRLLFNRAPKYFDRNYEGVWQEKEDVNYNDNLQELLSESESLFGAHPVYDEVTLVDMLNIVVTLVKTVIDGTIKNKKISTFLQTGVDIAKFYILYSCGANLDFFDTVETASEDVIQFFGRNETSVIEEMFGYISVYSDIIIAINSFGEHLKSKPKYFNDAIDYYLNEMSYDIFMELDSGILCNLQNFKDVL